MRSWQSAAIVVLAGFVVGSTANAEDQKSCVFKRGANLDITLASAGVPLVPVTIQGVRKLFLIDTAGAYSTVTIPTANELSLPTEPLSKDHRFFYFNGEEPKRIAHTETFTVGQLPLKNMSFLVMPPPTVTADVEGSIAGDILHFFDEEYDFANAKFQVFLQNDCGDRVVHWPHTSYGVIPFEMDRPYSYSNGMLDTDTLAWHIIVPGLLDGTEVDVTIDTGSTMSTMTLEDAREVFPSRTEAQKLQRVDRPAVGDDGVYTYPFKTLSLGAVDISNPWIILRHNKLGVIARFGKNRPQLILGMNVLQKLHLYVNYRDKKLYVTGATDKGAARSN